MYDYHYAKIKKVPVVYRQTPGVTLSQPTLPQGTRRTNEDQINIFKSLSSNQYPLTA
ncbi:hypothetical protein BH20BAC1_BH20BAC1_10900 [soil metagenome]